MTCPLCRSSQQIRPYLLKDGFQYLKCTQCNFIFLRPIPENIADFYQSSYFNLADDQMESGYVNYETDKSVMNNFYYSCLDEAKKIINSNNIKLLDIGAATGHFLDREINFWPDPVSALLPSYWAGSGHRRRLRLLPLGPDRHQRRQQFRKSHRSFHLQACWNSSSLKLPAN